MAWFTRFTRFGDVHYVFGQEQAMTCGPSSVLMCYTKLTKFSPSATGYDDTQKIRDYYAEWSGAAYDGSTTGTWPAGLVYALNKLGFGRWTHAVYDPQATSSKIIELVGSSGGIGPTATVKPIIVGVNWDGSTASHWVCIDTVRSLFGSSYATVCDPWDASVHVQSISPGTQFSYSAEPTIGIDFGGTHYEYDQPSTGRVRQWPIIHLAA